MMKKVIKLEIWNIFFSNDYGVSYFKQFQIVMNALDNRVARNHVNRMCLAANVPLIETGTAGYAGQVRSIHSILIAYLLEVPLDRYWLNSLEFLLHECYSKQQVVSFSVYFLSILVLSEHILNFYFRLNWLRKD